MNIIYLKTKVVRNCHMDCSGNLFKLFLAAGETGKGRARGRKRNSYSLSMNQTQSAV